MNPNDMGMPRLDQALMTSKVMQEINDTAAACAQGNGDVSPPRTAAEKLLEFAADIERIRNDIDVALRVVRAFSAEDTKAAAGFRTISGALTSALDKLSKG